MVATKASHLSQKSIKVKEEDKGGKIIMTEVGSKAEIGHVVETDFEGHIIKVGLSMDKMSEEPTLGEETSEEEVVSEEVTQETSGI